MYPYFAGNKSLGRFGINCELINSFMVSERGISGTGKSICHIERFCKGFKPKGSGLSDVRTVLSGAS